MTKMGVVAFAFGSPETIRANSRIGNIASFWSRHYKIPLYTQLDVPLFSGFREWPKDRGVTFIDEKPGNPPPTLRIAKNAVKWVKNLGLTNIWIVAAPPYVRRCRRDLKYAFREAKIQIKVGIADDIWRYPGGEWFCEDSTQSRTRSSKNWWPREIVLRLLPMFIYKHVAA